ncbi:UNVERIFIED_CONTAM: Disease resistance protein SUMM2 [Sesamum angustifolium]|uniref:Disease resistance protein SUMM2 n=1 Tax=Sesamum angustifolium TaxID=2727405 RepID=A0AAW2RHU9_9LAMI
MIELWNDALNALRRSEPLIRAEGLLEEHHDIEEVMDRGVAIIETLKDCSLLEHVDRSAVKIHDVIRDVSVWISSSLEGDCKSLVRELPDALGECPTTSTLLLQRNKMLEEIPGKFLLAFKSLRILDLSECTSIKSLPALDRLTELRALLLDKCSNLETLPPVGGLAKLQVFVCSETRIITLPQACTLERTDTLLNRIKKLKRLELSIGLGIVPSNFLLAVVAIS